jgi:hypothetical protein
MTKTYDGWAAARKLFLRGLIGRRSEGKYGRRLQVLGFKSRKIFPD